MKIQTWYRFSVLLCMCLSACPSLGRVLASELTYGSQLNNAEHELHQSSARCYLFKTPVAFLDNKATDYDITVVLKSSPKSDVKTVRKVPCNEMRVVSAFLIQDNSGSFDRHFEAIISDIYSLVNQAEFDESSCEGFLHPDCFSKAN